MQEKIIEDLQSTLKCLRNSYETTCLELQEGKNALEFELSTLQNKFTGAKSCMEKMLLDAQIELKKQEGRNAMALSMVEITTKIATDEKKVLQKQIVCLQDQINRLAREAQVQLQKSQDKIECLMYQYEKTKDIAECERTTMLSEIRQLNECLQNNMKFAETEVAKAQQLGGAVECELDHVRRVSKIESSSQMREIVKLKEQLRKAVNAANTYKRLTQDVEFKNLKLKASRDVNDLQNIIDEELARLREQALEDIKETLHLVNSELKKLKLAASRGQSSSYSVIDVPHEGMMEPNELINSNSPKFFNYIVAHEGLGGLQHTHALKNTKMLNRGWLLFGINCRRRSLVLPCKVGHKRRQNK